MRGRERDFQLLLVRVQIRRGDRVLVEVEQLTLQGNCPKFFALERTLSQQAQLSTDRVPDCVVLRDARVNHLTSRLLRHLRGDVNTLRLELDHLVCVQNSERRPRSIRQSEQHHAYVLRARRYLQLQLPIHCVWTAHRLYFELVTLSRDLLRV